MACALAMSGCDAPQERDMGGGDEPEAGGGKEDALGDAEYETRNEQAMLLRGFNPLVDRADATCVQAQDGPRYRVGADRESYRMEVVNDRQSLARALGIDLGLKVKYLGKSGRAELSFLDELDLASESLTLLITAEYSYAVSTAAEVDLNDNASRLLHNEGDDPNWAPGWFSSKCGNGYITGIRYASSFSVLITLDTENEKHAQSVASKLGFEGGLGIVELSAEGGGKLSQTLAQESLSASIDHIGEGFRIPAGDFSDYIERGVAAEVFTEETVARFMSGLDALRENARRSKEFDRCLDVGENNCQFVPVEPDEDGSFVENESKRTARRAPGYFDNVDRSASVRSIGLSSYRSLFGTAPSAYEALDWIEDADRRAREHLAAYAQLDERMTVVFQRELESFAGDKSAFNVAAPGDPVRDLDELQAVHDRWVDRFAPRSASRIGSLMAEVEDEQKDCFDSAKQSTFDGCDDASGLEAVEDALLSYGQSERLLPVRYEVTTVVEYEERAAACESFDTEYEQYRLATSDEAQRLAVAIARGPIDWASDGAHEVWYDAAATACDADLRPVYRNAPGDSDDAFECLSEPSGFLSSLERSALCVPSEGPMATVAEP